MAEPNWARVLDAIYASEESSYEPMGDMKRIHEDHALIEDTGLNQEEVQNSIYFLVRNDLVQNIVPDPDSEQEAAMSENPFKGKTLGLTKEGFEISHERRLQKTSALSSFYMVLFTFGLLGFSVINASLTAFPEYSTAILIGSILIIAIISLVAMIGSKRIESEFGLF